MIDLTPFQATSSDFWMILITIKAPFDSRFAVFSFLWQVVLHLEVAPTLSPTSSPGSPCAPGGLCPGIQCPKFSAPKNRKIFIPNFFSERNPGEPKVCTREWCLTQNAPRVDSVESNSCCLFNTLYGWRWSPSCSWAGDVDVWTKEHATHLHLLLGGKNITIANHHDLEVWSLGVSQIPS